MTDSSCTSTCSHIVSLGGGHGLFNTLRAARTVADRVTAVVTVADDGGSSGRLRVEMDVVPPGDLRMALVALTRDTEHGHLWEDALQYRFGGRGALRGHALGNLIISGLAQVMGSELAALEELGRLLGIRGGVLPVSPNPVDLEAEVGGLADDPREITTVRGQVAVASTVGQVRRVHLIPERPTPTPEALQAIADADLITLGPGSWFSSVIPHLLMPEIVEAINASAATKVLIMNLVAEAGETAGMSLEHHINVLTQHSPDLTLDYLVLDQSTRPNSSEQRHLERAAERLGAQVVYRDVRADDGRGRWTDQHSSTKLAEVLQDLCCPEHEPTCGEN